MDKADVICYLIKIIQFDSGQFKKDFGVKSDWQRFFELHKMDDKNLKSFVDWIIKSGILKEQKINDNGYPIYRPDYVGKKIAFELIECSQVFKDLDNFYDIYQSKKKGSEF